ncbi:hypothetical protein BJ508DRAFT_331101 [Ascobolus immersus RN42]|uniref:Uncharacterized protein n=1 Tax=Ascobolus immersus RN42 TaxID=1160509 RepID=A0A3N4HRT6_ASCIM|nr:hypothetical protein BJ508DRAFT_331101 [Ascobolus immersus RN42]
MITPPAPCEPVPASYERKFTLDELEKASRAGHAMTFELMVDMEEPMMGIIARLAKKGPYIPGYHCDCFDPPRNHPMPLKTVIRMYYRELNTKDKATSRGFPTHLVEAVKDVIDMVVATYPHDGIERLGTDVELEEFALAGPFTAARYRDKLASTSRSRHFKTALYRLVGKQEEVRRYKVVGEDARMVERWLDVNKRATRDSIRKDASYVQIVNLIRRLFEVESMVEDFLEDKLTETEKSILLVSKDLREKYELCISKDW